MTATETSLKFSGDSATDTLQPDSGQEVSYILDEAGGVTPGLALVSSTPVSSVESIGTIERRRAKLPTKDNDTGFVGISTESASDTDEFRVRTSGVVTARFQEDALPAPGEAVVIRGTAGLLQPVSNLPGDTEAEIVGYALKSVDYPASVALSTEIFRLPIELRTGKHRPLVAEEIADVSATAKVGGTTIFTNTTGSGITLTILDGTFDGQLKQVFGNKVGAGTVTVEVTNHFISSPYSVSLRAGGNHLLLAWNAVQGKWTTVSPGDQETLAGSSAVYYPVMQSSGGPKVSAGDIVLDGPNSQLELGVDLSMEGNDIDTQGGEIRNDDGSDTVIVNDDLDVQGQLLVNDAGATITVEGLGAAQQIGAIADSASFGVSLALELFNAVAGVPNSIVLGKARGTSGTPVIVNAGDQISRLVTAAYDGVDYRIIADILSSVVAGTTPASNDVEGQMEFRTSPGSGAIATALTLHSDQRAEFEGIIKNNASRVRNIITTAVNLTLDPDLHDIVIATATGIDITLPASPEDGQEFTIKRSTGGGPKPTVDGNGNDIDGSGSVKLKKDRSITVVYSDSLGEWMMI